MSNSRQTRSSAEAGTADSYSRPVLGTQTAPFPLRNRYRPVRLLCKTRLGPLYEAHDDGDAGHRHPHPIAVQVLNSHIAGDADLVAELRSGFETLQAHGQPNLPTLLGFERDERFVFIVWEMPPGVSARDVLEQRGALAFEDAAPIVRAVGQALDLLHSESIVHGGVEPENVLVAGDGNVRLLDIVPLRTGSPACVTVAGSLDEMRTDPRDDVFDLACLAYELVTGRHPFQRRCSPAEAARSGLEPVPPSSASERQWRALARALETDAAMRTNSVAAFLAAWVAADDTRAPSAATPQSTGTPGSGTTPSAAAPRSDSDGRAIDEIVEIELEPSTPGPGTLGEPALFGWDRENLRRPSDRSATDDRSSLGSQVVVAVVALGLFAALAWFYYPPVREGAVELVTGGRVEQTGVTAGREITAPERAGNAPAGEAADLPRVDSGAAPGSDLRVPAADDAEHLSSADVSVAAVAPSAESTPASSPADPAAVADPAAATGPAAVADPSTTSGPATVSAAEPTVIAPEGVRAAAIPAASARTIREVAAGEALLRIPGPSPTRAEGAGFVPVVVERTAGLSDPLAVFWWISQETATADEDYADFGTTAARFDAGQAELTLLVPLINDGIAEPQEHFFVYVGRRNDTTGALQPIASTRIDIVDDD